MEAKTQLGVKYPPERLMGKIYSLVIVQKVTTDNFKLTLQSEFPYHELPKHRK